MREAILKLLENNSKLTAAEIAAQLGFEENAVADEINLMEKEHIICGYGTFVDWDKTDEDVVSAIIEVRITPQRGEGFDRIADRVSQFKEVKSVYLMSSGDFDLMLILEGKSMKEVAYFVAEKLSPIDAVISTSTHFVLKSYKNYGVILDNQLKHDERMIVSP